MKNIFFENIAWKSIRVLFMLILFVLACLWLASASAVLVMYIAQWIGGAPLEWLTDKGWPRVMRRCAMFWAVICIVVLLKRIGWKGWRDCGFITDDPEWAQRRWWAVAAAGAVFGIAMLGVISALNIYLGLRTPIPAEHSGIALANEIIGLIIAGVFVSLIEETVCRGVLFRVASRIWQVWLAAILISMLFALAHFVNTAPEAFASDTFFSTSANVFISTLTMLTSRPGFWMRFFNLTLLGIALCAFVIKTKTIWFGIGAHAAWVWVIKLNSYFTDLNEGSNLIRWFGGRSDFMDSIFATAVLLLMTGYSLWYSSPRGIQIKKRRLRWHVAHDSIDEFTTWINMYSPAHLSSGKSENRPIANENDRKILKEYEGCRVSVMRGCVLKESWPRKGWKGFRFAVMPSRAKRSFILARKLMEINIPTAKPVAWAVKRRLIFQRASYAVFRELSDTEPLTSWLKNNLLNRDAGIEVMNSYGRLMAMFHANGYSNRDFKHENIMCSRKAHHMLWVVDLDGTARKLTITLKRARKDLMRVWSSLADFGWTREIDIQTFFNSYNEHVPLRLRINPESAVFFFNFSDST